jgi:hypothetical protein
MKRSKKTLQEFSPQVPHKLPKGNVSGSTNEMLHADLIVKTQLSRGCNTHAKEATNRHQNS